MGTETANGRTSTTARIRVGIVVLAMILAAGCSDDDRGGEREPTTAPGDTDTTGAATTAAPTTSTTLAMPDPPPAADADLLAQIEDALAAAPRGCDPLDTRHCLLPFPSDHFTESDEDRPTGRRVAVPAEGAPRNAEDIAIDMSEWNRNDGFSPNARIHAYFENIDPAASRLPSWTDLDASLSDDATVVMLDLDLGTRVPLWAELDGMVTDPADQTVIVHPAISLPAGHTFAVAFRGLVDLQGELIEPGPVFRAYRDGLRTDNDEIEERRPDLEEAFGALDEAGVAREDLQLAWTFTTASSESITARMLHIRDETLAELDGAAPAFEVIEVIDQEREGVARQIVGTFTVPNWLTGDGGPGQRFAYEVDDPGPADLPVRNGELLAPFVCNVSDAVAGSPDPGRLVQYGHGLLGSEFEINAGNVRAMSAEHGTVYCATKWAGMSADDIGNAAGALQEMSQFPTLADRLQQGVLNQIVLGRLMLAEDGLVSDPAFLRPDGSPLIDNSELVYDGNSQGGIMGMMLAAVSPDIERAVLGVPGMNYSLLLPRSVDFDPFLTIFEPAYPDDLDRSMVISLIQMLWDRAEGAGYVRHVVDDPLPGTPRTEVLLHVAFGDWQVTELSAFIAARTMGIPIHRPVTAPGRSAEVEPGWGLDSIPYPTDDAEDPYSGSAIIVWDSGSDPIPLDQTAPRTSRDSHEDPRADPTVRVQKAAFLFERALPDVCGTDQPCVAAARD